MSSSSSDRLKAARMRSGLRQIDIAERMKRSVSTIKNWEQEGGTSPSSLEDISKLCEIVGMSIDYYVNGRHHRALFTQDDVRLIDLAKKMLPETRKAFEDIARTLIEIQNSDASEDKE